MMQPQLRGVDLLQVRQSRCCGDSAAYGRRRRPPRQTPRRSVVGTAGGGMRRGQVDQRAAVIPMWRSPFGAQTYLLPAIGCWV